MKQPRAGTPLNQFLCIVYSQRYQIDLGGMERLHPFDINKYAKIYLGLQEAGLIRPEDVFVPEAIDRADILRVHTPDYLARLERPDVLARYLEFGPAAIAPGWLTDAVILEPFRCATGGTLLAAELALRYGMAVNLGGGYHHAAPDTGGGFCIYADMPIAIRALQAAGRIHRALVIDLDAHQGNGTAACFKDDEAMFTFDMHEDDIYPFPKETNDLDVALPAGVTDETYLGLLRQRLPAVFERAKPDIVILQAGVDVLDGDPLANLRLTPEGVAARDAMVFAEAAHREVPVVMVLGGGYSDRAWEVQCRSISALIERYGLQGRERRYPPRPPTVKEKLYTK